MRAAQAARAAGGMRKTQVNHDFAGFEDARETHATDQRVFLDNERQKRVFDPKVRTIGIDKQGLDQQVAERQNLIKLDQDREDWIDKQMVQQDKHSQALQAQCELIKQRKERDLQHYRDTYQKKQAGDWWDINDPDYLKKDLPARLGDEDPRCGPSSMQQFAGEDLERISRLRRQQRQCAEWNAADLEAKRLKQLRDEERDAVWAAREEEVKKRIFDAEQLQRAQKRATAQTVADFNRAMAAQKRREAEDSCRRNAQKDLEEINNQLNSRLLNEGDEVLCNGRRSNAKGLSHDDIQAIHNQQAQQREELRQQRIREAEDERAADARALQENAMSRMLEKKLRQEKQELQKGVAASNRTQQLLNREEAMRRKRLYAQEIGEQFFTPLCPPSFDECRHIMKTTR